MYHSPVPTGERWLAVLKKNLGIVRLLLKEGNLSHGDWMKSIILIIDDEESIRFSFGGFLESEGHNVITAKGYLDALARMDETVFKLILADIVLDDGWGIDILQEVMRRNLKTRVIIMTAYPSTEQLKIVFACTPSITSLNH
jgi:CheY-like chemotaxis protein